MNRRAERCDLGARLIRAKDFHFGKLHRDKRRGTAKLEVAIPGPGMLQLRGKSVMSRGQLKVGVEVTFRPNGGIPRTLTGVLGLVRSGG